MLRRASPLRRESRSRLRSIRREAARGRSARSSCPVRPRQGRLHFDRLAVEENEVEAGPFARAAEIDGQIVGNDGRWDFAPFRSFQRRRATACSRRLRRPRERLRPHPLLRHLARDDGPGRSATRAAGGRRSDRLDRRRRGGDRNGHRHRNGLRRRRRFGLGRTAGSPARGRQAEGPPRRRERGRRPAVVCGSLSSTATSAAASLGAAPAAGRAGSTASCRSRATTTESPSPTPSPGATLSCGATASVSHGCRIASAPTPSATSRAITETTANPGNPFPTAAEREAI